MSRRHHGRPHHGRRSDGPRPEAGPPRPAAAASDQASLVANAPAGPVSPPDAVMAPTGPLNGNGRGANGTTGPSPTTQRNGNGHAPGIGDGASNGAERPAGCTAPQLRRFIKSRPYVPMHELRRRFSINGGDDDVTPVVLEGLRVFVGLPAREGSLLGELLRGGEIGYELSFDPLAPIVVGVYPMRPVPRS
jgi:hypothetical protein